MNRFLLAKELIKISKMLLATEDTNKYMLPKLDSDLFYKSDGISEFVDLDDTYNNKLRIDGKWKRVNNKEVFVFENEEDYNKALKLMEEYNKKKEQLDRIYPDSKKGRLDVDANSLEELHAVAEPRFYPGDVTREGEKELKMLVKKYNNIYKKLKGKKLLHRKFGNVWVFTPEKYDEALREEKNFENEKEGMEQKYKNTPNHDAAQVREYFKYKTKHGW